MLVKSHENFYNRNCHYTGNLCRKVKEIMMKRIRFICTVIITTMILSGCRTREVTMISEELYAPEETLSVEMVSLPVQSDTDEQLETERLDKVVVYICGAVCNPGVYELFEGERVSDAVSCAGGLMDNADLSYTNLAERIADGEKIYIPTQEEVLKMQESNMVEQVLEEHLSKRATQDDLSKDGVVNINTADIERLCTLSGIGKTRAEGIIAYRNEHGSFEKIEDIMSVPGIKEASFQKIKDKICVCD